MDSNQIKEESARVLQEVIDTSYYLGALRLALSQSHMTIESIMDHRHSASDLISFWNKFWYALPDSRSIQKYVFYKICNLAELMVEEIDQ